ncbi:MAG: glyoxalase [Agathobacter sp.]|nr:glyoxalase [Agathobacter sp.]
MYNYDDEVIEVFLEKQEQLFPEIVAETPEEAEEFLEDCMAVVCKNLREVKEYFEEAGTDISGMSDDEILEASEVFELPSGRFLIVEG